MFLTCREMGGGRDRQVQRQRQSHRDRFRGIDRQVYLSTVLLDEVLIWRTVVVSLNLIAFVVSCTKTVRESDRPVNRQ